MKTRLSILCAAALIFLFAAVNVQAAPVVEIELTSGTSSVDMGAELNLTAVLTPPGATVKWTSSRPQYATVKAKPGEPYTCVVTGRMMGKTRITAKVGAKTRSQIITVHQAKASPSGSTAPASR